MYNSCVINCIHCLSLPPDPVLVHVILSVDRAHLQGLVAVMHSLLQHASHPLGVVFHVVLAGVTREEVGLYLQCYELVGAEQVRFIASNYSVFLCSGKGS